MKRWALLTIIVYLLVLSALTVPLLLLSYWKDADDVLAAFFVWIVPVAVLAAATLLLVPIAVVRERPVGRRTVAVSAALGALPMAVMLFCSVYFTFLMIWGEGGTPFYMDNWYALLLVLLLWMTWGVLFYRSYASADPGSFTATMTRWLLRGSILELLIAVPSHIISRQRDECCAPPITLLGITTGLAVALMSFGPGLFFLFAQRIREKTGK